MHSHGAAVDHPADPGGSARLQEEPGGIHVHRAIFAVGHARAAEHGREVVDDIHVLHCLTDHVLVADIALEDLDTRGLQLIGAARADQPPHPVPTVCEGTGECQPGESAGAGDENSRKKCLLARPPPRPGSFACKHRLPLRIGAPQVVAESSHLDERVKLGRMKRQDGVAAHQMWRRGNLLRGRGDILTGRRGHASELPPAAAAARRGEPFRPVDRGQPRRGRNRPEAQEHAGGQEPEGLPP